MHKTPLFRVPIGLLEVPGAKILVVGASLEEMVGDHQDGMTDRGAALAAPGCQALVECR